MLTKKIRYTKFRAGMNSKLRYLCTVSTGVILSGTALAATCGSLEGKFAVTSRECPSGASSDSCNQVEKVSQSCGGAVPTLAVTWKDSSGEMTRTEPLENYDFAPMDERNVYRANIVSISPLKLDWIKFMGQIEGSLQSNRRTLTKGNDHRIILRLEDSYRGYGQEAKTETTIQVFNLKRLGQ